MQTITKEQYDQVLTDDVLVYRKQPAYFLVRKDSITRQTAKAILSERWYPKSAITGEATFIGASGKPHPVYVMAGWAFHQR